MDEVGTGTILNPQLAASIIQLQCSLKTSQRADNVFLYRCIQLQFMLYSHSMHAKCLLNQWQHCHAEDKMKYMSHTHQQIGRH